MSIKSIIKTGFIGMFLRIPGVYKLMLSRIAHNPEALFNILEKRSVQDQIPAQLTFLVRLAEQDDVVETILRNLPVASRTATLHKLMELHPGAAASLFNNPNTLAKSVEVIANDAGRLAEVFDIATLLPVHGEFPTDRATKVFALLFDKPKMLRELGANQKLRCAYLDLFLRALDLSKTDMKRELESLERYRANPSVFDETKDMRFH